ncbi:hypothetical protein HXX76_000611 [Chlamydomonas incerta]|uniref:Uncharacterized protein n=1 Tax=Chlamydomonas incerta TaxID=51695 RepID=A0A835WEN5_CHLIN|nr:hypothetical protein HXX76_000611 [Chlamydomonas incerta]|eukprot:KAG2446008.1 hypothetical protein HXX76_000611 [Chlamydomonas incerta]
MNSHILAAVAAAAAGWAARSHKAALEKIQADGRAFRQVHEAKMQAMRDVNEAKRQRTDDVFAARSS